VTIALEEDGLPNEEPPKTARRGPKAAAIAGAAPTPVPAVEDHEALLAFFRDLLEFLREFNAAAPRFKGSSPLALPAGHAHAMSAATDWEATAVPGPTFAAAVSPPRASDVATDVSPATGADAPTSAVPLEVAARISAPEVSAPLRVPPFVAEL
jgi:hypothetical protein